MVLNVNEIAEGLLSRLGSNAVLNRHPDRRWTIAGTDVCIFYPRDRRLTLEMESLDDGSSVLVSAIPGVDNLEDCWSNSADDLYTVEAAEVLEKCLLWNYQNALESWRLAG